MLTVPLNCHCHVSLTFGTHRSLLVPAGVGIDVDGSTEAGGVDVSVEVAGVDCAGVLGVAVGVVAAEIDEEVAAGGAESAEPPPQAASALMHSTARA
ncbi:hypothetical protein [Noviherbaspirillum sp.]|uniref:hypothetical protein n=1 Tax=Noviherbaspirillum sp. TaxID=1926288 RepID=UPI0025CBEF6E|nr:hypothetical protein [Noviherbaspirillum sp.]